MATLLMTITLAVGMVIGTVIGSGIFLVPKTMIQRVGTVEAVFAVWVVGGLVVEGGCEVVRHHRRP